MPGRPPTKAITMAMMNEAYRPTCGSTPAMIEKAIASGISASATTMPANTSLRGFMNHSRRYWAKSKRERGADVEVGLAVICTCGVP